MPPGNYPTLRGYGLSWSSDTQIVFHTISLFIFLSLSLFISLSLSLSSSHYLSLSLYQIFFQVNGDDARRVDWTAIWNIPANHFDHHFSVLFSFINFVENRFICFIWRVDRLTIKGFRKGDDVWFKLHTYLISAENCSYSDLGESS